MEKLASMRFSIDGTEIDFVVPYYLHLKALLNNIVPYGRDIIIDIASRVREIDYIVDVGACVGSWAIAYAMAFPKANILAIEPSKANYPYLLHNIREFPNISPMKLVVGKTERKYRLSSPDMRQRENHDPKLNTGLISIYGLGHNHVEDVEGNQLDNIVNKRVDWLKIDVEGAELDVLMGAERIITNDRPILQVEIRDDNQDMARRTVDDVVSLIGQYRYSKVGMFDADWICIPREIYDVHYRS